MGANILLTGVTGFVGKVVLEELLRRRDELQFNTIYVLIRDKGTRQTAEFRFETKVATSACFAKLPNNWCDHIKVISGDLIAPDLAMSDNDTAILREQATYIINCVASIKFDPPLAEAAASNITSCLNLLEFARSCTHLKTIASFSTAYVTPHPGNDALITESLMDFPMDPEATYQSILDGKADSASLLQQTGHPSIYTFTKCLSEQLLARRKGNVPLILVRPSIISASWQFPEPGWIDSPAAFAAFVSLVGLGIQRTIAGNHDTVLDIVPCDVVAARIIDACFSYDASAPPQFIQHAVVGTELGCRIDMGAERTTHFFQHHPVMRWPDGVYIGQADSFMFRVHNWRLHTLPAKLAELWFSLLGKAGKVRTVRTMIERVDHLNTAFSTFTHRTFNFDSSVPMDVSGFTPEAYIDVICDGVHRHLLGANLHETVIAGRRHRPPKSDLKWSLSQPIGNSAIRLTAYIVKKCLRKCTDRVTFDRPSFENALRQNDPGNLMVIAPSHRSHMDFVLCSYLFFSHPELNIAIPHIAADSDFERLPFLGWFLKKTHAFYIKRGQGQKVLDVKTSIQDLVKSGKTIEFFIEGTRSRSRQFIRPKLGLMRSLQSTQLSCTILPISISYDLIPEMQAFIRELKGGTKSKLQLRPLFKWLGKLVRGKIDIGRVHIVCGEPLLLEQHTDVHDLSQSIVTELQDKTVTTTFHLKCFLHQNPILDISVNWLQEQIEKRGGTVLKSNRNDTDRVDPIVERTMRYHWLHYFYPEALAYNLEHPVIQQHVSSNAFVPSAREASPHAPTDVRVCELLHTVFEPVCNDYAKVLKLIESSEGHLDENNAKTIISKLPACFLPNIEEALEAITARQIIVLAASGNCYVPGSNWSNLKTFTKDCAWNINPRPRHIQDSTIQHD
jgi:alcohol-forming fatty acyl-CoA reductase